MKKAYIKPSFHTIIFDSSDVISLSSTKLQTGKYTRSNSLNIIEFDKANEIIF